MSGVPRDYSEPVLVESAAGGDIAALEELLLLHHDRLRAHVTQSIPVRNRAATDADDICQEAYASAFQAISGFCWNGDGSFFAWLRTLAMRRLADALRRQSAAKRGGSAIAATPDAQQSAVDLLVLLAEHSRTPSRVAARREACDAVLAALSRLKPEHELVLRLRFLDAVPVADIASRLGRTPGSIHMLCARALQALEDDLGDAANYLSRMA